MQSLRNWWKQYRYRFVPWIALNLRDRSVRSVAKADDDKIIPDDRVLMKLEELFQALHGHNRQSKVHRKNQQLPSVEINQKLANVNKIERKFNRFVPKCKIKFSTGNGDLAVNMASPGQLPRSRRGTLHPVSTAKMRYSLIIEPSTNYSSPVRFGNKMRQSPSADDAHQMALHVMDKTFGFCIEKRPSILPGGGTGVVVTRGTVAKHSVVAMYPGLIYQPFEPILLQSIANPFIFRCIDHLLIDGNDKGLSKFMYRSCAGRDRLGPYKLCDKSWITAHPKNPLAIGQYVNNRSKGHPANVLYHECDLPPQFPIHLRQYVPNTCYTPTNLQLALRLVVLVSLREIHEGEELFSSYFTVVH